MDILSELDIFSMQANTSLLTANPLLRLGFDRETSLANLLLSPFGVLPPGVPAGGGGGGGERLSDTLAGTRRLSRLRLGFESETSLVTRFTLLLLIPPPTDETAVVDSSS